jgi:hypothetical protein
VPVLFPVRYWEWEASAGDAGTVVEDMGAIGRRYLRVERPTESPIESRWIRTAGPIPMEWHVRVRGAGRFDLEMQAEPGGTYADSREVASVDWTWVRVPVPGIHLNAEQTARLKVTAGALDLDALLLTRAGWSPPAPGESLRIPATAFFRAGYTLDDFSGVAFRRAYDRNAEIFYSRNLYLEPGTYRVRLEIESDAPEGTPLGEMAMHPGPDGDGTNRAPIVAGRSTAMDHVQPGSKFFRFAFDFARTADVTIRAVTFDRVE